MARLFLDKEFALVLYNEGKTDREIAAACGVSKTTVSQWRRDHGLPSHMEAKRKAKQKLQKLELDAIQARKEGLTYGQYKAKYYVPPFIRP